MADYSRAVALAKRLIDKKGQDVTLRRIQPLTPRDPSKPWAGRPAQPVDEVVTMVFLDFEQNYIDGTTVQQGDLRAYLAAADATAAPTLKDVVIRNGVKMNIVKCSPLAPAEQEIFFELQVRR